LNLGILLFCLAVLFQLVTLPVEYDASHRAVNLLDSTGILVGQEVGQTRKVLNAAALTYVAGAGGPHPSAAPAADIIWQPQE